MSVRIACCRSRRQSASSTATGGIRSPRSSRWPHSRPRSSSCRSHVVRLGLPLPGRGARVGRTRRWRDGLRLGRARRALRHGEHRGFAALGDDGDLYNSAAVVGPDGLLAVYRKTHLWDREKLWFTPGTEPPPVVETPFGRIGVAVCYDLYFPELTRGLALAGADLIAVPANLRSSRGPKLSVRSRSPSRRRWPT